MTTINTNLMTNFLVGVDKLSPTMEKMAQRTSSLVARLNALQGKLQDQKVFQSLNKNLEQAGLKMSQKGIFTDLKGKRVGEDAVFKKIKDAQIESERAAAAKMKAIRDRDFQDFMRKQERMLAISKRKAFLAMPAGMEDLTKFQQMGTQLGTMRKQGINVNAQLEEMQRRLKGNQAAMAAFRNGIMQGAKSFDMFNLSLMFGGMFMQRMGMSIVRFMIPSMDTLNKLNNTAAKKVQGVAAAFEFLKISIFETLMSQDWFGSFVEKIVKMFISLSEFAQEHPKFTAALLAVGAAFVALGTAGILLGGIGQIGSMFKGMWGVIKGWIGADGKGGTIGTALKGFKSYLAKGFVASVGIGLAAYFVYDMLKAPDDWKSRALATLGITMGLAVAGAAIGSIIPGVGTAIGALVGAVVGLAVGIGISIYDYFMEDKPTMEDFKKAIVKHLPWLVTGIPTPFSIPLLFSTMKETDVRLEEEGSTTEAYAAKMQQVQDLMNKEEELNQMKYGPQKIQALNALQTERAELQKQIPEYYLIQQEIMKNNAEIQRKMELQQQAANQTQEVSDWEIAALANTYAEQLKSTEHTQIMIDNAKLFGVAIKDVMGGKDKDVGVIGHFKAFGESILKDNEYFTTLKTDIENWASTTTVKKIELKYVATGAIGRAIEAGADFLMPDEKSEESSITG